MSQLQKVLWTKGILLSPQHLQAQDRYLESLVQFQLTGLTFSPWGFSRLELDREALAGGTVAVTSAAGLFPDGLPFDLPGSDVQPAPKPIEAHWGPDQRTMAVYLAVPEHRLGGHNVSLNGGPGHTRYVAEAVLRRDENSGLMEKPLQMAKRNLRLLVEGESIEGNSVLQVARVVRAESGQFQLDPGYVPPLLDIAADAHLMSIARRLLEVLSARSTSLAGTRRHRNRGLADFGASDAANFWLLYTINTHLPVVRHIYEVRRGHPEVLYRALVELAASLTTFSTTIRARDLPPYDHSDLGGCFGQLDTQLRELLETVVPVNHVILPLRPTGPLIHAAALDDERVLSAPNLYLGVRAEVPADQLARRVPGLLKVSAADRIEMLIRQADVGVGLHHVPTPPNSLPVKLGYQYFQLDRSGQRWAEVRAARNLAVYVPPAELPEAQLELVALLATS